MTTSIPTTVSIAAPELGAAGPRSGAGADGLVRMVVARIGGRTRIVDLECRAPLQVLRAHRLDPALEDMAFVMVASPAGGVLQGDRLRIDIEVREGARLHLDTQSATRLYRMPDLPARLECRFHLAPGGYLEYVPDPFVPFAGSNVAIRTEAVVDPEAALILGEVVAPGRAARGEVHAMTRFESALEMSRPDGGLAFSDATVLEPGERLADPGMLGGYSALGSLHVMSSGFDPEVLRAAVDGPVTSAACAGASTLPGEAGAWLRVLADDTATARRVVGAAFAAARTTILGVPPPNPRRS
jgi:urease accessory protein